jgi:hypothetical protein
VGCLRPLHRGHDERHSRGRGVLAPRLARYEGKEGSGVGMPINMVGVFTDQGVAGEAAVGKSVPMRTVIRIENEDRHVFELYFTPPGKKEVLATRAVYTRIKS